MAKVLIDIQDDVYKALKEDIYPIPDTERLAIVFKVLVKKGKLLPDNATNGDVIKALFPDGSQVKGAGIYVMNDNKSNVFYDFDWWNAPYKAGDTN